MRFLCRFHENSRRLTFRFETSIAMHPLLQQSPESLARECAQFPKCEFGVLGRRFVQYATHQSSPAFRLTGLADRTPEVICAPRVGTHPADACIKPAGQGRVPAKP